MNFSSSILQKNLGVRTAILHVVVVLNMLWYTRTRGHTSFVAHAPSAVTYDRSYNKMANVIVIILLFEA